jgi:hypothetical protein
MPLYTSLHVKCKKDTQKVGLIQEPSQELHIDVHWNCITEVMGHQIQIVGINIKVLP